MKCDAYRFFLSLLALIKRCKQVTTLIRSFSAMQGVEAGFCFHSVYFLKSSRTNWRTIDLDSSRQTLYYRFDRIRWKTPGCLN